MKRVTKTFANTQEAVQALFDELSEVSQRLTDVECELHATKLVLSFFISIDHHRVGGTEDILRDLVAGWSDGIAARHPEDEEGQGKLVGDRLKTIGKAMQDLVKIAEDNKPKFEVLDGGKK